MDVNRAEVVAEVVEAFDRYERSLVDGDNETVAGFFWADPRLVRFGLADQPDPPQPRQRDAICEQGRGQRRRRPRLRRLR